MTVDIASLAIRIDSTQAQTAAQDMSRMQDSGARLERQMSALTGVATKLAAVFATLKVIDIAKDAALLAARYETLGVVMRVAGNNAGYTGAQMLALEKELTKTGISVVKARENLTSLATANIDLSKATKLARAAQDLAVVGNINSSEAFTRLTQGIKSGEVEVLRTLGLNVSFENSYKKLASQIGTTSEKLTEQQKIQARTNATLDAASRYTGIYEESMGTAGKMLTSLSRYTEDLKVKLGAVFNSSLKIAVEEYTKALKDANSATNELTENGKIDEFSASMARGFERVVKVLGTLAAVAFLTLKTMGESFYATGSIITSFATGAASSLAAVGRAFMALFEGGYGNSKKVAEELSNAVDAVTTAWKDSIKTAQDNYKTAGANIDALTAYTGKLWEQESAVKQLTQEEIELQKRKEAQRIAAGAAARAEEDAEAKKAAAREASAKALKKLQEDAANFYKSTISDSQERIAVALAELNSVTELTEAEKRRIKVLLELDRVRKGLKPGQAKQIEQDAEAVEWLENLNEAIEKNKKARSDQVANAQKDIDAAIDTTRGLKDQVTYYGKAADSVLRLKASEMDRDIAQAKFKGDDVELARLELLQAETLKQADLQQKLIKMEANTKFWTSLEDTAHSTFISIASGGDNAAKRLKNTFKNVFFDWLYQMTIKKWIINIQGQFGGSGISDAISAASGSSSSGTGLFGSAMNLFSIGKTIYSGFSSGIASSLGSSISSLGNLFGSEAVSAFGTGMSLTTSQASTAAAAYGGTGTTVGGGLSAGASAASAIPIIGWIIAGMNAANGFAKQGFTPNNGTISNPLAQAFTLPTNFVEKSLGAIGVGKTLSNILSGAAINTKLFGRADPRIESQGVRGTISASGVDADAYANIIEKGGLFRSSKRYTKEADLSAETDKAWDKQITSMITAVKGFGSAMGIQTDAINSYAKSFDIKLTGDETKDNEAIAALFAEVGDELSLRLVPSLKDFKAENETLMQTVQRLAADYTSLDAILSSSGAAFGQTGLASIAARERLIALAGGIEALASQQTSFNENFLTQAERLAPVQKYVTDQLAAMGLQSLDTRDKFKAYVLGLASSGALATESGAKTYASLLSLSEAFAQVHAATEDLTKTEQEIFDERKGLQDQLDELTMTQAQLAEKARNAIDSHNRALYDQVIAAQAARDMLKTMGDFLLRNVDYAYSNLEKSVNAEKSLLTKAYDETIKGLKISIDSMTGSISKLKTLSQSLHTVIDSMNDSTLDNSFARADAQAQVATALAIAKAGGPLPTSDSLKTALATLSKDPAEQFATFIDYRRSQNRVQNMLTELADLTDDQLSTDEKALALLEKQKDLAQLAYDAEVLRLDKILENAKASVDALNGILVKTASIPDALAALATAIKAANSNPVASAGSVASDAYKKYLGRDATAAEIEYWRDEAAKGIDIAAAIAGSSEAKIQELYRTLLNRTGNSYDVDAWEASLKAGFSWEQIRQSFMDSEEYKKLHSIPGFASGGDHLGGLRIVGENGPELESTGPSRIFTAQQTRSMLGANNGEIVEELRASRAEAAAARAEAAETREMLEAALYSIAKSNKNIEDFLDGAVNGGVPITVAVEEETA